MTSDQEIVWPQAALEARELLLSKIPKELILSAEFLAQYPKGSNVIGAAKASGLLTDQELEITSDDVDSVNILQAIKDKKWSAVDVVTAFGKRAMIGHQLISCLTNIFLDEGVARAKELDAYYEKTGKLVGPLHGLPISIKEHMAVKGKISTIGVVSRIDAEPETAHSHLIQILVDAGAVLYVKTNHPQTIMHQESHSFWGETLNPHNTGLTPGGSSGGCAALIAFGGSPMGIGGDIGGSLRVPAVNSGIWTLKPTTLRVPSAGNFSLVPGNDGLVATSGPLCKSCRDIDLWCSVMFGAEPWIKETSLVPLPWKLPREIDTPQTFKWIGGDKIKIGVMWSDEVVLPQPPMQRALKAVVAALREKASDQFEIVNYKPMDHAKAVQIAHRLYFADGGESVNKHMAMEPILSLTEFALNRPGMKYHTMTEYLALVAEKQQFREAYGKHWTEQEVDIVLCPSTVGPAPKLGTSRYWGYASAWNLVDYAGACFPTGLRASAKLDPVGDHKTREPLSDYDKYFQDCYIPEIFEGAPLGLQLVSRRYQEEKLMLVMSMIAKILPLSA